MGPGAVCVLRTLLLVLSAVLLAPADTGTLVERARERRRLGNDEGARVLLERALEEDPRCGPAMLEMIGVLPPDDPRIHEWQRRYLLEGWPLDPGEVPFVLFRESRRGTPPVVRREIERASLLPDDAALVYGPWPDGVTVPCPAPAHSPAGPLRVEAFGAPDDDPLSLLRRVADRWRRDGYDNASAWVALAERFLARGDRETARRLLGECRPGTLRQKGEVATLGLRIASHPVEWWRERGEPLLPEVAQGTESPYEWYPVFGAHLEEKVLAAGEVDLYLGVEEALAECDLDARGMGDRCRRAAKALVRRLGAAGTLGRLEERASPFRDCVRAMVLEEIGQVDLANKALRGAIERHPDSLVVHACWVVHNMLWQGIGRDRAAYRGFQSLERAAERAGRVLPDGFARDRALLAKCAGCLMESVEPTREALGRCASSFSYDGLLGIWSKEGVPAPLVEDFVRAYLRIYSDTPPDTLRFPGEGKPQVNLALLVCQAGRIGLLLTLARGLRPNEAREVGRGLREEVASRIGLREGSAILRALAAEETLGPSEDGLLRVFCGEEHRDEDTPVILWCVRQQLLRDEAFLRQPSGHYVVSLLFDRAFEVDEARRHRRLALERGCRAPGLLADLVEDGQDVLNLLRVVDPTAARLREALAAPGVEALRQFLLEEDRATPEQSDLARRAIDERSPPAPRPEGTRALESALFDDLYGRATELSPAQVARRCNEVLLAGGQQARMVELAWDSLPLDVREVLRDAQDEGEDLGLPHDPTADELRETCPWDSSRELESIRRVLVRGEAEAFRKLLTGPYGLEYCALLESVPDADALGIDYVAVVREIAAREPLDLRWVEAEENLPAGTTKARSRLQILLEVSGRQTMDAGVQLDLFEECEEQAERQSALARYLELRAEDPVESLLLWTSMTMWFQEKAPYGEQVVETLRPRCKTDRDLSELARRARIWSMDDVAAEIDRRLLTSADPEVRLEAMLRDRERDATPRDPAASLALAETWPGTEEQQRQLWVWAARDALDAGNDDLTSRALAGVEEDGPVNPRRSVGLFGSGGRILDPLLLKPSFAPFLVRSLERGDASGLLWLYADYVVERTSNEALKALDPGRRCFELGLYPRAWVERATRTPGQALEAVGTMLAPVRVGEEAYGLRERILRLARGLVQAGRPEEAASCADAWAERCGPVTATNERAESERFGIPIEGPISFLSKQRIPTSGPLPSSLLSACVLIEAGGLVEARARLEKAIDATVEADARELYRVELASCLVASGEAGSAVRMLENLRVSSSREVVRSRAQDRLRELLPNPAARGAFIDLVEESSASLPPPPPEQVSAWAGRLGAIRTEDRDRAQEELSGMGRAAIPVLRALRRLDDAEVRERAEELLFALVDLDSPRR